MRDRPFLSGGDSPRPFSDIRAERDAMDMDKLARDRTLREIEALEAEAAGLTDPSARILRQLDAEALRASLEENVRRS